jgi:acetyl-CoA C-acetyltransferase
LLVSGKTAKALRLPLLGRVRGFSDAELPPIEFPVAPAVAIPRALKRAGVTLADVDAFEINEAFSAVPLAVQHVLKLDANKVNMFGGAVSMGHPLGSSGCRILVTCLNVLRVHQKKIGCVAICNGGGGGSALVVERLG